MKVTVAVEIMEWDEEEGRTAPVLHYTTFQEDEPISRIIRWANSLGVDWDDREVVLYHGDIEDDESWGDERTDRQLADIQKLLEGAVIINARGERGKVGNHEMNN